MSMLSSMCDQLRKTADKLDEFGKTLWRGRDVLDDATRELRDAADTILQLRDDLQRANAENASLRGAAQGLGELCDKYRAENAELRELAKRMWPFAKAYLNMLPMLGIPDSESYDIEIELKRMHVI